MIKITKLESDRPKIIFTSGPNKGRDKLKLATEALVIEYESHRADFHTGSRKFTFDSGLYGHKKIKTALTKIQANKCCFCEAKVTHVAHGDIEHFRPKGGYKQLMTDTLQVPGYFWLAYDWMNFYFSCQICNQRFKKNLFPLNNSGDRAQPLGSIATERPVFIDPGQIDPQIHITFVQDEAVPIDSSPLGANTINELGLNRPEIRERRLSYLIMLNTIKDLLVISPNGPEADKAKNLFGQRMKKTEEYSSMVQALFS